MKQEGQINGFTKAIWTGVTTLTLAKAMEQALKENPNFRFHSFAYPDFRDERI